MNKSRPLVSIIIPSYNHDQFIEESIQSVINQVYDNIELIVIDDGSRDGSVEAIKSMAPSCQARFKKFVFRERPNKGISATLNEGIDVAEGEFIGFCSSDDSLHRDKISEQVSFFLNNKDSDFCFTKTYVQDDAGNILPRITGLANRNLSANITFEDIFTFKVHFPVTGMYRSKFLKDELRGFDESLTAEDYDINLRIVERTKVGFIDKELYYYRSNAALGSSRKRPLVRVDVSQSHRRTIEKYANHPKYKQAVKEWNFRRFSFFSRYRKYKIYALKGLLYSLEKASKVAFYKALFRLLFVWK